MQAHSFNGAVAAIVFGTAVALFPCAAHAGSTLVGTAFSYQGQLKQGGAAVNGAADLQYSLWDGAGGTAVQVGTMQQIDAVNVVDGLFRVELDFGPGMFEGEERWLQIAVRSPAGAGTFTTLTPRQALRAVPQAQFAMLSGGIADGGLPATYSSAVALTNAGNAFIGSGAGLTNLDAASITTGLLPGSALGGAYSGALTLSNAGNAFTGSGAGLVDLNATTIATGTLANARTTGTATNTPNTLVLRDGSGDFSAGIITANGSGLTSLNATNITGGQLANARTTGTSANTFNTLVLRDGSGNFSAGTVTATHAGDGAALTGLNASALSSGVLPSARLGGNYSNSLILTNPSNQFAGTGSGLTGLNASALAFGTIPGGALGGTYNNPVTFNNGFFGGTHAGDGLSLVNLNANALVSGTVPGPRLAGPYANPLSLLNASNSFAGSGAGLTGLNATNITSGTIANLRTTGTSANTVDTLVLRDASGNFSAGTITATHAGNGAGLTNINASNITSGTIANGRTTANVVNSPSTLVQRDVNGSFTANQVQVNYLQSPWLVVTGIPGFNTALSATSEEFNAIQGVTNANVGVGVYGINNAGGRGVVGQASGVGSFAVYAQGNTGASGTKSFQIDHPRDPENKYLLHYSAEGPEPYNLYRGNVMLNGAGEAWVDLPEYFQDINRDFHYQLTSVGAPAPNLHVGQKIVNNTFKIAGGPPLGEVSWTVTATRNDEYVRHYPTADVREKPAALKGTYQHPEIFGQPVEKGEAHRRANMANPAH